MQRLREIVRWLDRRTGLWSRMKAAGVHPIAPGIASAKKGWFYIFGAATLVAFIIQAVTGITLATKYIPSPAHAYESLQFITDELPYGSVLRGMHYFGASAMVIFMFLHLVRVFLTGSYKFPREMNWVMGAILFFLTLGMAYTGQLLRWDQNGVWSVVVAAHFVGRVPIFGDFLVDFLLGGDTVGGTTLSRFYAFHVFFLPGLLIATIAIHLYLVLRNGISEPPEAGKPVNPETYIEEHEELVRTRGVPYVPDGAWREALVGLGVIVAVAILAIVAGPRQLGGLPDPSIIQADPRPDWYFRWYYALIAVAPGFWTNVLLVWMPLAAFLALFLVPLANRGERHPLRRPWAIALVAGLFFAWAVLTWEGIRAPWVPDFATEPVSAQELGLDSGPVYDGARLFYGKGCQYCHGVIGSGGHYGPDLTNARLRFTPEELTWIILTGRGDMPPYRDSITPDELAAILAFLDAIKDR
jgi:ubiquinol-cytochrome c reductase cytochrome b subunit